MQKIMKDVAEFMRACDQPVHSVPQLPPWDRQDLRVVMSNEEHTEYLLAVELQDLAGIADALADKIFVDVGTALEYGIPLDRIWAAVVAANMAKIDPTTGKVRRREDGKILKPEGWQPPDIEGVLGRSEPNTILGAG